MVELNEIRNLLDKEVVLKWGKKEYHGKVTNIDEDTETFSYEYTNKYQSAGNGGCAHKRNVVKIQDNILYFE